MANQSNTFHPTLARQLRRSGINLNIQSSIDLDNFMEFLHRVNQAYLDADQGRYIINRSLEVYSEEMRTLQRAAEESSKAKTLFLANMSHEIRTPMNGILGMLTLLTHSELSENQKNYVEKSLICANSLLHILDEILDLSKIESGKIEFETLPFNIHTEFNTLLSLFRAQNKEKELEINLRLDKNLPAMVKSDPHRLKQIINNLVNNAIKFTPPKGKVVISVDLLSSGNHSHNIQVCVSDSGIGIAPKNQEKIFDLFSQADESITRKYGGTGLGLTITKQLVEQMGGEIAVSSQENKGSAFTVKLKMGSA